MTPSAKVSIRQVGIRRAESRAGQRAEHCSGAGSAQAAHRHPSHQLTLTLPLLKGNCERVEFSRRTCVPTGPSCILHACWSAGPQPVTPNHSMASTVHRVLPGLRPRVIAQPPQPCPCTPSWLEFLLLATSTQDLLLNPALRVLIWEHFLK